MRVVWKLIWGAVATTVLAGWGAGCAASEVVEDDDESSTTTTGSQMATGTGGGGGTSGAGGGTSFPCGQDCSLIDSPACLKSVCNMGEHPGAVGSCVVVPEEEGTVCDDGLFCTVDDACDGMGTCAGGPQNDCGMAPPACNDVVCDEASKSCSSSPVPNDTPCTSTDLCEVGAVCTNGTCGGGTIKDCFFEPVPSECFVSECNPSNGMCEPIPGNDGESCTDLNDLCSVQNTCSNGVCSGGNPMDCSAQSDGCQLGVCDAQNGQCTTQALMNGDACDDLDACTTGETCGNGTCTGGSPVTSCINGDGCCPTGCDATNDIDCAITDLDIGTHNTVYSSGSSTRGFWFTAPTSFTIQELRVPLEVGTSAPNNQNIQVVKFTNGPPPLFSMNTTAFTTLFYSNTDTSNDYISANIPIQAGDVIGILGARGTTTMRNSYGSGNAYSSTILGMPVSLQRLIYQANLHATQAGPLSTETGGSYTRIEVRYSP